MRAVDVWSKPRSANRLSAAARILLRAETSLATRSGPALVAAGALATSELRDAGVRRDLMGGDELGLVRGDEQHGVRDILRLGAFDRQRVTEHRAPAAVPGDPPAQPG